MDEFAGIKEAYGALPSGTAGGVVTRLEQACAAYVGAPSALALTSGRAAIHVALKLAGVKAGDRVLCSDLAPMASAAPIRWEGATPVFVDSEPDTWNMEPAALAHAISLFPDARVCLVTHLYGTPAKLAEIQKLCDAHHITLIENACDAFGALYQGKPVGSFGRLSVLSFGTNKILTGSSGGMLLGPEDLLQQARSRLNPQGGETGEEWCYPYAMAPMVAGTLCAQWPRLQQYLNRKQVLYRRYQENLKDLPLTMQPYLEEDSQPNHWLPCLLLDPDLMQEKGAAPDESGSSPAISPDTIAGVLADMKVETRRVWQPLHTLAAFKGSPFVTATVTPVWSATPSGRTPVSQELYARGLCLPGDVKVTLKQVDRICSAIRRCFDISLF